MLKIEGKSGKDVSLNIRDITFKTNNNKSTILTFTDASLYCYQCTFDSALTAIEFKWGIPSNLVLHGGSFTGVVYGIKAQHTCAFGTLEISNTSLKGVSMVSNTGIELKSYCIKYPYPRANIHLRMDNTDLSGFFKGVELSIAHVDLFAININNCTLTNHARGALLIGVGRSYNKFTKIAIRNTLFRYNSGDNGGAFQLTSTYKKVGNVEANVTRCRFERNKATTIGGAVAVKGGMTMRIEDSHFEMNDCRNKDEILFNYGKGSGGALGIDTLGKEISVLVTRCVFKNNAAASYGGAIYTKAGSEKSKWIISNTTLESLLENIEPAVEGDLIYSEIDTTMSRVKGRIQPTRGRNAIHLAGQHGSTVDALSEFTITPGFSFQLAAVPVTVYSVFETRLQGSRPTTSGEKSGAHLSGVILHTRRSDFPTKTKSGSSFSDTTNENRQRFSAVTTGLSVKTKAIMYRTFSLNYLSCPYNHYALTESAFRNLTLSNSKCDKCPDGGICRIGQLKAEDNFWGYKDERVKTVRFIRVPDGYGCIGKECVRYDSCRKYRTGQLCGVCKVGYGENFLSTNCIPDSQCNKKTFWMVACLFIITYVMLFLYRKETIRFLKYHLLWFRRQDGKRNAERVNNDEYVQFDDVIVHEQEEGRHDVEIEPLVEERQQPERDVGTGFLKICFYYYQIQSVLTIDRSEIRSGSLQHTKNIASSFFNFKFAVNGSSPSCFGHSATPVQKILLRLGLVGLTLLFFVSLYSVALIIERLFRRQNNNKTFSDRVLTALLEIFLQCYAALVSATFKLIQCIDVNGKAVLYAQGDVKCFENWQYLFIVVAIAWVLPFCIVILCLPFLLSRGRIREKGLFFACIFPLAYLMMLVVEKIRSIVALRLSNIGNSGGSHREDFRWNDREENGENNRQDNANENGDRDIQNDVENQGNHDIPNSNHAMDSILTNLTCAFAKEDDEAQCLWWEGVLMLRRLIIIAFASLIDDPYTKLYLLILAQILFLLHHLHAKPYSAGALNAIETASLTLLTLITSMNFLTLSNDGSPSGNRETLSKIFAWLQIIAASFLPVTLSLVLILLITLKIFHVFIKCIRLINVMIKSRNR